MKIGNIRIDLEPNPDNPMERKRIILRQDKQWEVMDENGDVVGLFPSELRIASAIQEFVKVYNGNEYK